MSNAGVMIISFLIFIIGLAFLIVMHELGHFAMAKAFKVYVYEFSIGFGPKLLKKKGKKSETYFSLRALPFGGYVSMVDEGEDAVELIGYEIPKERTISGINRGKKIIIMLAGIVVNLVLGYVLLFINNVAFQQNDFYNPTIGISEVVADSPADKAGFENLNTINFQAYPEENKESFSNNKALAYVDLDAKFYHGMDDAKTVFVVFNGSAFDRFGDREFSQYFTYYFAKEDGTIDLDNKITRVEETDYLVFSIQSLVSIPKTNEEFDPNKPFYVTEQVEIDGQIVNQAVKTEVKDIRLNAAITSTGDYYLEPVGLRAFIHHYRYNFGQAFGAAGKDWVDSSASIFKAIGGLFSFNAETWGQVGGPIAIFQQTEQIVRAGDFGLLFSFWGMISVNLAIMNLLPVPGLDGASVIITLIETIIRRDLPKKAKTIMNTIGLVLLIGLMVVIFMKDIIRSCAMIGLLLI